MGGGVSSRQAVVNVVERAVLRDDATGSRM